MTEDVTDRSLSKRNIIFAVVLIICLAASLTIGLVLHFQMDRTPPSEISYKKRGDVIVDCHPEKNATEAKCTQRGCTWSPFKTEGMPWCIFPSGYGYKMVGNATTTTLGIRVELQRSEHPVYLAKSSAIESLFLDVEFHEIHRLRLRFYPKNGTRWEIPDSVLNIPASTNSANETERTYDVTFTDTPQFGIIVRRKSTNTTVFNTTLPGFIYTDQYLQLTTRLSSDNVFGFGEHNHRRFRHDLNWKTWAIFTRDAGPGNEAWNLYGAQPVYMNLEHDGKANMVFLKNSNAMEVVLQPNPHPAVTFRTIGGVLDFYIFLGDSPKHAVQLYTENVGRPVMPPYWTLGFHLCRWGYVNITDMRMVIDRNRAAEIPYDAQWGDIEFMHEKYVFSYDREAYAGLPELVRDLHDHHQKFVVITDPGIGSNDTIINAIQQNSAGYNVFRDGVNKDIFVKNSSGDVLIATVWPGVTAYPDFTNPATAEWWRQWAEFFHNNESVEFDSLWIDMNEPSSFVPGSIVGCPHTLLDYPPYTPNILGRGDDGRMYDKTICMSAKQSLSDHYNVHSLYAHTMAMQTYDALKTMFSGKRPWTMTRSNFAGTGRYATKWMGDNQATWDSMKWSLPSIFEFSMFGFALNGADICGFWYEAEYEMCVRWTQLGAFYPFSRNHNGRGDDPVIFKHQDPAAWDDRFIRLAKDALYTRYRLLPYLYTLMHRAHADGDMVMQPLLFEFPTDNKTLDIDDQFLLGPALLMSPVLNKGQTTVFAYFPDARWFDLFQGTEVEARGERKNLSTPLEKFNLHVRGGHVIPWQVPSNTTYASRQKSMGLIVALDDRQMASGDLFWDNGEDLETYENGLYLRVTFEMNKRGELIITPTRNGFNTNLEFDTLEIYGQKTLPHTVTVDGVTRQAYDVRWYHQIIQILNLNLRIDTGHNITWSSY